MRSLTAVRVHCNNAFGREIGVFSATELHFSLGGKVSDGPHSQRVVYVAGRDDLVEQSRSSPCRYKRRALPASYAF